MLGERMQILNRSERRAMERAKEKHVRALMSGGYGPFKDITNEEQTRATMAKFTTTKPEGVFLNGLFIVQVFPYPCEWGDCKRVMIRWNDARPDHDWALFQRIKNDLFGEERVCLEVYPAEANKQDVANMYWLFLLPEHFNCPIEWKRRKVQD
jgi:hypothetical protein